MTFGEHLEELRGALLRALVGVVIGGALGLIVGYYVVDWIQRPMENALRTYYAEGAVAQYAEWSEVMTRHGRAMPYTLDEFAAVVNSKGYLPELQLLDPVQAQFGGGASTAPAGDASTPPDESANSAPDGGATAESATSGAPPTVTLADLDQQAAQVFDRMVPVVLWHSAEDDPRINPVALSFTEPFSIYLKTSLLFGAVIASPWVFYQLWLFVAAGLYSHERQYVRVYGWISLGLFLLGASMVFLFVFEPVLGFLLEINRSLGFDMEPRISEWLSFVLLMPIGFGLAFQLPLVMLFLERIGIFPAKIYVEKWRIAILIVFILSAVLTPADPYSMLLLALPLSFLYGGGILLCRWMPRSGSPVQ